MVPVVRFELTTYRLRSGCSTTELNRRLSFRRASYPVPLSRSSAFRRAITGKGILFLSHLSHRLADHRQEGVAVAIEFAGADTGQLAHAVGIAGFLADHFQQCAVMEDDVGRHALGAGEFQPAGLELVPEIVVGRAEHGGGAAAAAA